MNLHPVVIHIPIACLVLYSLVEIIGFFHSGFREKFATTKYFLLVVGLLGAFTALQTGEIAQELLGEETKLISLHETYAEITYKLYMIILLWYGITWAGTKWLATNPFVSKLISFFKRLYKYGIVALLSLIWFALLSIVWALGWAISHGPSADFATQMVYDMLVK